jgi:sugar lactone lactonase YvrE
MRFEGQEEDGMKQRSAVPTLAALVVVSLFGSLSMPVTAEDAKPGTIVTVAGTGSPGYSGDNGPATQAQLAPGGLALDASGNLYVADWFNNRVRKISQDGTITTLAGTGKLGFSGDGGKATEAQFNRPAYVIADGAGNLFISDFFNHRVRRVDAVTGVISTYAGSGTVDGTTNATDLPKGRFSGDNGPATDAWLDGPTALAVDALGNLFIADAYNHRVRKVSPDGTITTVAGSGVDRSSGSDGLATESTLAVAWGLAVDARGNLFIAETGGPYDGPGGGVLGNRVRKVSPDGIITTVAGTGGKGGFSGDSGKAADAQLNLPHGLAVDSAGNLFIADEGNYRVRKVSPTGIITTVVGNGKKLYAGDGALAMETGLRGPNQLAIDAAGNLLISAGAPFWESGGVPDNARVLKVVGVAAPGLLAGMGYPR